MARSRVCIALLRHIFYVRIGGWEKSDILIDNKATKKKASIALNNNNNNTCRKRKEEFRINKRINLMNREAKAHWNKVDTDAIISH